MKDCNNCIFLIGFMGSGKTTVGRVLARRLGARFLDTDEMIEASEGIKISEIFSRFGEPYFRDLETKILRVIGQMVDEQAGCGHGEAAEQKKVSVISVGGGLPVREVNRQLMHEIGTTIFLTAEEETLVRRLTGSRDRPLLQGVDLAQRIRSLTGARMEQYLDAADHIVSTDGAAPEEIADEITGLLGEMK